MIAMPRLRRDRPLPADRTPDPEPAAASPAAGRGPAAPGRVKLRDLAAGQRAVVVGYEASDAGYRARLLAMGLTRGVELTLVRVAPLGDPVKVELRGYGLSLRKAEADALTVERRR